MPRQVVATEKLPIKMWLYDLDESALQQAKNLANLPFAFKHIALMPDSHGGYGMPIGSVLCTQGVIVPNAVGVDIGCGMIAVRTDLTDISRIDLLEAKKKINEIIPVGFNKHEYLEDIGELEWKEMSRFLEHNVLYDSQYQLGTLGGGNHFIEIQKGDDGYIWIMIHSGSRKAGHKVAEYYNEMAKLKNAMYHSAVTKDTDLAFLPLGTYQGDNYLKDMRWCVAYAKANRELIAARVLDALGARELMTIDTCHNEARMENHYGKNVMVHRKGAVGLQEGNLGTIPSSQGTPSYIVEGLCNPESFNSCSHGAGRKMGRKEAIRKLDLETVRKELDDKGLIHSVTNQKSLDEAPDAYKNIDEVMENQKDLVNIVVKLTPLMTIKG